MLIFFILSSVSMMYTNIIDFLKYGYSWEVITIINEIQVINTQFLFSNILFSFILILGLIGCMFNLTGWYQLKEYDMHILTGEQYKNIKEEL